ncbi:MAG: Fur family transcriptional regulator [Burkholderiales bacterium]|nr:MAG: Fur family transcriptional regulator [Burkholderiales bacterium]
MQRLERAGLRRTRATEAVVGLFQSDPGWSPSHAELEMALQALGLQVNRVTLYRLLDRLVEAGILERHTGGDDRTWRFGLAPDESGVVPRFECDACHRQFRLTDASEPTQAVAQQLLSTLAHLGHQGQRVDLSIHGTCAVCVEPSGDGQASPEAGT